MHYNILSEDTDCFIMHIDFDNAYIRSYPHILDAAKVLSQDKNLIAIAYMVYGWMPTILKKYRCSKDDEALILSACEVKDLSSAISLLRELPSKSKVNNSWVGLSKVLHFLNPTFFPIWDSKIAMKFGFKHKYQFDSQEKYMNYCLFIHQNIENISIKYVQNAFKDQVGYEISKVRALEFILFL